ncbi:hypothetical protein SAMN06298216_3185 [Spirosomataceae bacterium TFI 002]|nr:hypothetical protein SAMN06298216_3185 [Spirosomataceae bacterium TFI 002]
MRILLLCFLLISTISQAQLLKNIEVEVVGRPTWDMEISLGEEGLIFLVKSDVTKINIFKFDSDLNEVWRKEYFLDAERAPKAYTIANDNVSFLFSETQGMYYQVFEVALHSGELIQSGFELRDFFVDQDYVFLDNKVIMAGSNANGAAFYQYDFENRIGDLVEKDITGDVQVNLFEYLPDENKIESLWSVKVNGYSNEKKKKGQYIKDSYIVHAVFDTTGNLISKHKIGQNAGKFPTQAQLVRLKNGDRLIMGLYQSTEGDKGVFTFGLNYDKVIKTYPFTQMLKGPKALANEDLQQLYTNYKFLDIKPILGNDGQILFGGVFFSPKYNTVTEYDRNNNYPYGTGYGSRYGYDRYGMNRSSSRSRSREVFVGFNYPTGFVAEFTPDGTLLKQNRIDLNHQSMQIQQPITFNQGGSVAFCVQGDVATNNFNISNKPIRYKLSEESNKQNAYLPHYEGVYYWFNNYFFAIGSRSKIEAISVNDNRTESSSTKKKKRRKKTPASFSQVRKVFYLTKIASGV